MVRVILQGEPGGRADLPEDREPVQVGGRKPSRVESFLGLRAQFRARGAALALNEVVPRDRGNPSLESFAFQVDVERDRSCVALSSGGRIPAGWDDSTRASRPVSTLNSRAAVWAKVSPGSVWPPGGTRLPNLLRWTSSTRPRSTR